MDWLQSRTQDIVLILDEMTYEILEYSVKERYATVGGSYCFWHEMQATDGEYGVEIEVPDAILEGSRALSRRQG